MGGVWFVFCPFSGLKVEDENADRNDVFYYILDPLTYEDYDNAKFRREWPLLANTKKITKPFDM